MRIPDDISKDAYSYMFVVLMGTGATVFYNMISNILRALGDSKTPLYFLIVSSVLNILLDILFIIPFKMGCCGSCMGDYTFPVFVSFIKSVYGSEKI